MTNQHSKWPSILLVDNDPGRIEHLENLLYHRGYLMHAVSEEDLEARIAECDSKLVLTFLPFNRDEVSCRGMPVLVVVPDDVAVEAYADPTDPRVQYLRTGATSEALLEKIHQLIGSGGDAP